MIRRVLAKIKLPTLKVLSLLVSIAALAISALVYSVDRRSLEQQASLIRIQQTQLAQQEKALGAQQEAIELQAKQLADQETQFSANGARFEIKAFLVASFNGKDDPPEVLTWPHFSANQILSDKFRIQLQVSNVGRLDGALTYIKLMTGIKDSTWIQPQFSCLSGCTWPSVDVPAQRQAIVNFEVPTEVIHELACKGWASSGLRVAVGNVTGQTQVFTDRGLQGISC